MTTPTPHRLGPADAPLTLEVFGTYECLHCRRAWPTLRGLVDAAGGALQLAWWHFAPAGAFPAAPATAAAAEAAAAQGAFWPMHEALMTVPAPLAPETLVGTAAALGLDAARFDADRAAPGTRARVAAAEAEARRRDVRGTPTLFLDGARVDDAWDLDALRERVLARVDRAA